jgi:general secretion pathway protein A
MLKRLPAHVRVAYVLNSKLEVSDALASICDELSIELPSSTGLSFTKVCTDALNQDLLQAHAQGKKTLIVIEEAQNLTAEVLETLRLLSNLETHTHKLLHILLVGQPELLEILAQKELRQLNQRVVSRFHLLPLDRDDLANYVNHRLHRAGAKQPIFDSACMSTLYKLTQGVPRLINLVCQHSLLAAYSTETRTIRPKLIKQAAVEILGEQKLAHPLIKYWPHGLAAALLVVVAWLITAGPGIESQEPLAYQEPPTTPTLNPFAQLLSLWSINNTEVYSQEDFVAVAKFQGLQTQQISGAEVIDLEIINRPGIVRLETPAGYAKSYLLTQISSSGFTVTNGSDSQLLDGQAFRDRWSRSFTYLWRPPIEIERLALGDIDVQAVSWLQSRLQQVDQNAETIISGGRYTQAIANQVLSFQRDQGITADAVVGRETMLRLNQLTATDIPLLTEGSN